MADANGWTEGEIVQALERVKREVTARLKGDPGFPAEFSPEVQEIDALIHGVSARRAESLVGSAARDLAPATERSAARGGGLTAAETAALRPHVVTLDQGLFSDAPEFPTAAINVDQLFAGPLLGKVQQAEAAGQKVTLLFYAHGGLVDLDPGLRQALDQIDWWTANEVYPIFFVWETGFWNTVEHLLVGVQQRSLAAGARDFFDVTTDPVLEVLARALGGPKIWGGMKRSAELASQAQTGGQQQGGANYVAEKVCELMRRFPNSVELHAIGHSAGAIFHSHFIPAVLATARALGVTVRFDTLQLLAPAITVDAFRQRLRPLVGQEIGELALFGMKQDLEKADNCARVYHKSLLYLIYYALEAHRKVDLMGLEESIWRDGDLKTLFGLDGAANPAAESIWSQTPPGGLSASRSTSHGGFHDDRSTMESVLRRIRKLDASSPIVANPRQTDGGRSFETLQAGGAARFAAVAAETTSGTVVPTFAPGLRSARGARAGNGRRRALCVGIDAYGGGNTLYGCIADAELWARTLRGLGFDVQTLLDATASYSGITTALKQLIAESAAGDVVVFQYSGHGTEVPDPGDAEPDQAIVPIDYDAGHLLIDKDLNRIFGATPEGVNLTCFFDCCHSGDLDRLFLAGGPVRRPRFLHLSPEQVAKYQRFAIRGGTDRRSLAAPRGELKDISFAACQSSQVAYESNGQGDFTLRATSLLRQGLPATSNRQFCDQIVAAFGANPRQLPRLDGAFALFGLPLLAPFAGRAPAGTPPEAGTAAGAPETPAGAPEQGAVPLRLLAQGFRQLAATLESGH